MSVMTWDAGGRAWTVGGSARIRTGAVAPKMGSVGPQVAAGRVSGWMSHPIVAEPRVNQWEPLM